MQGERFNLSLLGRVGYQGLTTTPLLMILATAKADGRELARYGPCVLLGKCREGSDCRIVGCPLPSSFGCREIQYKRCVRALLVRHASHVLRDAFRLVE